MTTTFLVTLAIGSPRFSTNFLQWLANVFVISPALKQPFMDGAYWSIVYEITFYGWVFVLIATGAFRRHLVTLLFFWLIISYGNEMLAHSQLVRRALLTDESGFFAAGIVLYQMSGGRRPKRVLMELLLLAVMVAVTQACLKAEWNREHYTCEFDTVVVAIISISAIGIVAAAMRVKLRLPTGLIMSIGGLTYPLYLLHQHIGYMLFNYFSGSASPGVLIGIVTVVMLVGAWIVWRFIERPAQQGTKKLLTNVVRQVDAARSRISVCELREAPR